MSRNPSHTVTSSPMPLPVILELGPQDSLKNAAGRAVFLAGERGDAYVRVVTNEDIRKRLKAIFTPKDILLYVGTFQLKHALESGDELAMQAASEKVRPWLGDFAEFPRLRLEVNTVAKRASLKRLGTNHGYSAFVNYSRLVAERLKDTRLVMWFSETDQRLSPAVFCPDWRSAAFLLALMERVRVCANPRCNEVFVQTDKEHYHTTKCGAAYRTARSRWKAKLGKKKDKKPL